MLRREDAHVPGAAWDFLVEPLARRGKALKARASALASSCHVLVITSGDFAA
jgi:hypothetical protein